MTPSCGIYRFPANRSGWTGSGAVICNDTNDRAQCGSETPQRDAVITLQPCENRIYPGRRDSAQMIVDIGAFDCRLSITLSSSAERLARFSTAPSLSELPLSHFENRSARLLPEVNTIGGLWQMADVTGLCAKQDDIQIG